MGVTEVGNVLEQAFEVPTDEISTEYQIYKLKDKFVMAILMHATARTTAYSYIDTRVNGLENHLNLLVNYQKEHFHEDRMKNASESLMNRLMDLAFE